MRHTFAGVLGAVTSKVTHRSGKYARIMFNNVGWYSPERGRRFPGSRLIIEAEPEPIFDATGENVVGEEGFITVRVQHKRALMFEPPNRWNTRLNQYGPSSRMMPLLLALTTEAGAPIVDQPSSTNVPAGSFWGGLDHWNGHIVLTPKDRINLQVWLDEQMEAGRL